MCASCGNKYHKTAQDMKNEHEERSLVRHRASTEKKTGKDYFSGAPKQVEGYHRELKDVMKKHSFGPTFVNKPAKDKAIAKKVTHDKNSPDYPDYFKHLDARAKRRGEQDM